MLRAPSIVVEGTVAYLVEPVELEKVPLLDTVT